jgi:hypothetical protein
MQTTSLHLNQNLSTRHTMAAKVSFCPEAEQLESRSLLNIGTPVLGAFLGIEGLQESEHRAMVQQRVHARTLPRSSEHTWTSVVSTPTFTWQMPASLPSTAAGSVHPHSIPMQMHPFAGRDSAGTVQPPAHSGQNPLLSVTPTASLPAGAFGAFHRG